MYDSNGTNLLYGVGIVKDDDLLPIYKYSELLIYL